MRTIHALGDNISLYDHFIGTPAAKINNQYIKLVAAGHKHASRVRVDRKLAFARQLDIDFLKLILTPYWRNGEVVFDRFDGTNAFVLKVAGKNG